MTKIILQILEFINKYSKKLIIHLTKLEKPLTKIISTQYDKIPRILFFGMVAALATVVLCKHANLSPSAAF